MGILEKVKIKKFNPGDVVFKKGDKPTEFYVIAKGEIAIAISTGEVKLLKDQDFFGEITMILGKTEYDATAKVQQPTELVCFSKEQLVECFIRFPKLEERILQFGYLRSFLNIATKNTALKGYSCDELSNFFYSFAARRIKAGQILFKQGTQSGVIFLIIDGEVEVERDGEKRASARTGDFLGEISFLKKIPHTATARTKGICHILECQEAVFEKACQSFPRLKSLLESLAHQRQ